MKVVQFSSDVQFTVDYCPVDYLIAFETYLFNEPRFFQSKTSAAPLSFYILHSKKKMVLARIHFSVQHYEALSLPQSPFGGLEINPGLSLALLDEFVSYVERMLKVMGLKSMKIKQFAFIYSTEASSKITNVFIRKGFTITHPDINHHVMVDSTSFFNKVHPMEKRKIKKAQDENFIFQEKSLDGLDRTYNFILSCRLQKSQKLNITLIDLKKAINIMPDNYRIFSLNDGDKIIACSVVVVVNERIVYNFLPASSTEYKQYSPMVFLLAHIYDYCFQNNVQIFDLGVSAVDNLPQHSLLDFKERIGGVSSLKCTFEKKI